MGARTFLREILEQFYFAYGHGSIADLGHVTVCLENISELAAIRLEDEPLWDGQAKSTRYQNFAVSGCIVPEAIQDTETEGIYRGILGSLYNVYQLLHDPLKRYLSERDPCPEGMKQADYERTIAARVTLCLHAIMPLSARETNVGQVVSIRTLEKQMTRLLSSPLPELERMGEELKKLAELHPSQFGPTWRVMIQPLLNL